MNFINNIKIRNKLILILILPIIGFSYFSIYEISEKYTSAREMERVKTLSVFAIKVSALVHELQKERAFTVLFIDSKGTRFSSELSAQRAETDRRITDLETFLKDFDPETFGSEVKSALNTALSSLDIIQDKREASNSLSIPASEIINYYSNTNALILDTIVQIPKLSSNAEISAMIAAHVNFLLGKEKAGIERAVLTDTFANDRFRPGMFNKFSSLVSAQDIYLNIFMSFATPDQKDFYKKKMQGQFIDEVIRMRKTAFEKGDKGGFEVDAAHWVRMMTGKINLLYEVEDRLSNDLRIKADRFITEAQTELTIYITLIILTMLIMIILSYFTAQSILYPLTRMVESSRKISSGDLTADIEINSMDEIGTLANTFKDMTANLKQMFKKTRELSINVNTAVKQIEVSAGNIKNGSEEQTTAMKDVSTAVEGFHDNAENIAQGMEQLLRLSEDTSSSILETAISIGDVDGSVGNLVTAVGDISTSIEDIAGSLGEAASKADNISKSVDVTAASLAQIDDAASEIERHARETADLSNEVAGEGERGMNAVKLTHAGMEKVKGSVNTLAMVIDELGQRSKEIDKILNVIDDVATETNLLALNATIIAAQAGEHGRGFAVVAERIRELAEKTAASTKEITGIISGIQSQIKEAVGSAQEGTIKVMEGEKLSMETISILESIMGKFKSFQDMSLKIAKATQEQARENTEVTHNLEAISSTTHQMAGIIQEQSRESALIVEALEKIRGLVSLLKKATINQTKDSRVIASNTENVMKSVQEIDAISFEQEKESQGIATAVMETTTIAEAGMENARHLEEVVEMLKNEVIALRQGLERFKLD